MVNYDQLLYIMSTYGQLRCSFQVLHIHTGVRSIGYHDTYSGCSGCSGCSGVVGVVVRVGVVGVVGVVGIVGVVVYIYISIIINKPYEI